MSFHCTYHIVCNVVHSTLSGICFFKDQWRQWKEHHFRTFGGRTAQIWEKQKMLPQTGKTLCIHSLYSYVNKWWVFVFVSLRQPMFLCKHTCVSCVPQFPSLFTFVQQQTKTHYSSRIVFIQSFVHLLLL